MFYAGFFFFFRISIILDKINIETNIIKYKTVLINFTNMTISQKIIYIHKYKYCHQDMKIKIHGFRNKTVIKKVLIYLKILV